LDEFEIYDMMNSSYEAAFMILKRPL